MESAERDEQGRPTAMTHSNPLGVVRVISGGQTGVDRAALDAAIALGIPHGGWCPRGRIAEDGPIPCKYELIETDSSDYVVRTQRNVVDSDGTLILYRHRMRGGTQLTNRLAKQNSKPVLRVNVDHVVNLGSIQNWILRHKIRILNIAGPRASSDAGIYTRSLTLIGQVLSQAIIPLVTAEEEQGS